MSAPKVTGWGGAVFKNPDRMRISRKKLKPGFFFGYVFERIESEPYEAVGKCSDERCRTGVFPCFNQSKGKTYPCEVRTMVTSAVNPWYEMLIVRISWRIQSFAARYGIYIHNPIADECTQGFECCMDDVRPEDKHILNALVDTARRRGSTVIIRKSDPKTDN